MLFFKIRRLSHPDICECIPSNSPTVYMASEVCSKSDLWWPVCKVSYITCPSHFHIYEYPSKHLGQHMALQKCSLRCMWKLIWGLGLDFEFEKLKNIFRVYTASFADCNAFNIATATDKLNLTKEGRLLLCSLSSVIVLFSDTSRYELLINSLRQ